MTDRIIVLIIGALSLACAPAGRVGEQIHIAEESAIIIWDDTSKTQHFIRRASFETRAKDFGFLVPTPTTPKLVEASDSAFDYLEAVIMPHSKGAKAAAAPAPAPATAEVVVVERVEVAGLDAAVLAANDAEALGAWLQANGYASTPELMHWASHYVQQGWIITAFKIAATETARRLDASSVRMTFKTDRPYFPYREPASVGTPAPRALHVYFLGKERVDGKLGVHDAWPSRPRWSGNLSDSDLAQLVKLLKLEPLSPSIRRLTAFYDASSSRHGREDLYFHTAADQSVLGDFDRTDQREEMAGQPERYASRWYILGGISLVVIAVIGFAHLTRGSGSKN